MTWHAQLYGYGMLSAGYAAGIHMNGRDWTGIPWWGDLIFALAILSVAFWLWVRAERSAGR